MSSSEVSNAIGDAAGRGRVERSKLYTITVGVTGRCNAACTYCHYYRDHHRKDVAYDISDELFDTYLEFIARWFARIPHHTTYRFSGGDPLVLGDRLFRLAGRAYARTAEKPFVLTSGKALSKTWLDQARQSPISHVFVSIENPIQPDRGAPDPKLVVKAIRELDSAELPIVPGVCVVPNHCFEHLYDICSWFYREVGRIPVISEINYSTYTPPTEREWRALALNLERVLRDFYDKTPLNLFCSVSPELAYGTIEPHIFHLGIENAHGLARETMDAQFPDLAETLIASNHTTLSCLRTECPWFRYCSSTVSYWQGDKQNTRARKLADYCRFKRLLNDTYYRVLVDSTHAPTILDVAML